MLIAVTESGASGLAERAFIMAFESLLLLETEV